jgi:hypothetical protein
MLDLKSKQFVDVKHPTQEIPAFDEKLLAICNLYDTKSGSILFIGKAEIRKVQFHRRIILSNMVANVKIGSAVSEEKNVLVLDPDPEECPG